jgi:hypothetical protein
VGTALGASSAGYLYDRFPASTASALPIALAMAALPLGRGHAPLGDSTP